MSNLAAIGHNQPPTPFDETAAEIDGLYEEAEHWLDGAVVDSEELAEGIAILLNTLRLAGKDAEALRKEEKKPLDDAAKAVQEKFKPLTDKVKRATDACKKALTPWLAKKEAEQRTEAEEKRRIAEQAEAEARKAIQETTPDNLRDRAEAEEKVEEAKRLTAAAKKAENTKANTKNNAGKAIGLKTAYTPELTDGVEAARHYWLTHRARMEEFLLQLAAEDVRAGKREIPGFTINEEKRAV